MIKVKSYTKREVCEEYVKRYVNSIFENDLYLKIAEGD